MHLEISRSIGGGAMKYVQYMHSTSKVLSITSESKTLENKFRKKKSSMRQAEVVALLYLLAGYSTFSFCIGDIQMFFFCATLVYVVVCLKYIWTLSLTGGWF